MRVLSLSPLAVALLVTALCGRPVGAQPTVYVPDDYPTIQGAIDAALDGWTILVRPGTYVENIDYLGKEITVQSTDGPDVTTIDGSQPTDPDRRSTVYFGSGETFGTVLRGFSITGGRGSRRWSSLYGGGIAVSVSAATIRDCIVEGNSAKGTGGGIDCWVGDIDLVDSIIRNNEAAVGGGLAFTGASFSRLTDVLVQENTADRGGGLGLAEAAIDILRCSFVRNTATDEFGEGGGALYAIDEPHLRFYATVFLQNQAECGGAIFSWPVGDPGRLFFESCLFAENVATREGGAIYAQDYQIIRMNACTVVLNDAQDGSAFWCNDCTSDVILYRCIFAMNSGGHGIDGEGHSGEPWVVRSLVEGGGFPGHGNIPGFPVFRNPLLQDFRLASSSILIDRGGTSSFVHDLDLDGNPRIVDGDRDGTATVDMGCYEYQPEPFDARLGSVNTAEAGVNRADVLLVNGSPGDAERVVTAAIGEPLQLDIAAPPSRPGPVCSRYVVYAWVGEPDPLAVSVQERAGYFLGWTAFPTVFSGGSPQPLRLWNTFGHEPILGEPDFVSEKAPTTLFALPNGRPAPITATFQGFVEDDAAPNEFGVATTNAVVLRVE